MLSDRERRALDELERSLCVGGPERAGPGPSVERSPLADGGTRARRQQTAGMAGSRPATPVVVAVGAGDPAADTLHWAAAEAAAQRRPLRIVHVVRRPIPVDPDGWVPVPDGALPAGAGAAEVLGEALRRTATVAPDLAVSAELLPGAPVRALLGLSREVGLLVMGGRRSRRRLLATAAGQVVPRARCPVVVVGPRRDSRPGLPGPRVVVGVDPGRWCPEVMDFAVRAALQRGVPLVAVAVSPPDLPADLEGVCALPGDAAGRAGDALDRLVAPWRDRVPELPLRTRVRCGDPAAVLAAESAGAALVVVGSRPRDGRRRALSRSVSCRLLPRAGGPLAVVPPDRPVRTGVPAGAPRWGAAG